MLINQMTSLLLETSNPMVEESITIKQRVASYQKTKLPATEVKMILQPSYSRPNQSTYYAERDVLLPLVTIDSIKGKFDLGKKVSVDNFEVIDQFDSLFQMSELDWENLEGILHGDNNFTDSLILGVYFHSIMKVNNYDIQNLIINRATQKKFKRLELDCTMHHFTFHDKKVNDYCIDKNIITDFKHDCSFAFKVVIMQDYVRKANPKKALTDYSSQDNPDDEENNVTINVEVEEIER